MNRRSFLGTLAAIAAAAVGAAKVKSQQPPNLYGSRMIDKPLSHYVYEIKPTPSGDEAFAVFAQNDLNPNSVFSRIRYVDSLPQSGQVFCKQGVLSPEKVTGEVFVCPDMSYVL